ncbi:MAG TPA: flagellar biosynthesis anti-sigma factor FlgM [Steroidobacteraceae bacterium]
MPVNLNGIELSGMGSAATRPTGTTPKATDPTDPASPDQEVQITSTATLLASLQQSLAARPAIDQQRVEALARSIAAGTYATDPQKIANGFVAAERVLSPLPRLEL